MVAGCFLIGVLHLVVLLDLKEDTFVTVIESSTTDVMQDDEITEPRTHFRSETLDHAHARSLRGEIPKTGKPKVRKAYSSSDKKFSILVPHTDTAKLCKSHDPTDVSTLSWPPPADTCGTAGAHGPEHFRNVDPDKPDAGEPGEAEYKKPSLAFVCRETNNWQLGRALGTAITQTESRKMSNEEEDIANDVVAFYPYPIEDKTSAKNPVWVSETWDGGGLAYPHRTGFRPVSDQCHVDCTVPFTV